MPEVTPPPPPRPDPVEPVDRSMHVLLWLSIGVNALLALFTLSGWFGRPRACPGGCSWRPAGGVLWVLLVIVDVGLVMVWASIGYGRLVSVGERIGRRISDKRDDDPENG
jgi:hypothetical protein